MARSDFGSSGYGVPPTDRVAEASFYDQRDREGQDRRRRQSARQHHATLIDLLFEEVEPAEEKQQKQIHEETPKRRPRARPAPAKPASKILTASQNPPEPHPAIPHEPDEETDRRIRLAAEAAEDELRYDDKVREARQVSTQLRYCLSQHTETARKVSSYLHALLMITHGHYKPKLVIEV